MTTWIYLKIILNEDNNFDDFSKLILRQTDFQKTDLESGELRSRHSMPVLILK